MGAVTNMKLHKIDSSFLITVSLIFMGMLSVGLEASASETETADDTTNTESAGADPPADMVLIPASEFQMGDGSPAALIDLPAYFIDVYEVTNREYEEFILADGYQTEALWSKAGWAFIQSNGIDRPLGLDRNRYNGPDQPVVGVSWYEADAYARWANKRLPMEVEWEKAARGTDGRKYPWENEMDFSRIGYSMADNRRTFPVGSFPSSVSPYGLHDCAGNVSEWVADNFSEWLTDRYDKTYDSRSPRKNPTGPKNGRISGVTRWLVEWSAISDAVCIQYLVSTGLSRIPCRFPLCPGCGVVVEIVSSL